MPTMSVVEGLRPAALSLLKVLSVLDNRTIQEKILTEGQADIKLKDFPTTPEEYIAAREQLAASLILFRYTIKSEIRVLSDKLYDSVRESMEDTELGDVFHAASSLLWAVWPYISGGDPDSRPPSQIAIARSYAGHVRRLEDRFSERLYDGAFEETSISGYLFSSCAWYMWETGSFDRAVTFSLLALRILKKSLEKGTDEVSTTYWIAEAYRALSETGSFLGNHSPLNNATRIIELMERKSRNPLQDAHKIKIVEIWKENSPLQNALKLVEILEERAKHSKDRRDLVSLSGAYVTLGIAQMQDRPPSSEEPILEEAIKSWEKSIETFDKILDRPRYSNAWARINLCIAKTLKGDMKNAESIIRPSLAEFEENLGRDDRTDNRLGHLWCCMGKIRSKQELYDEALEFFHRAKVNLEATLGKDNMYVGDIHYEVGKVWDQRQDPEKAELNWHEAKNIYNNFRHCDPQLGRVYWKLGISIVQRDIGYGVDLIGMGVQLWEKSIAPNERLKKDDDFVESDWDDHVIYWSR